MDDFPIAMLNYQGANVVQQDLGWKTQLHRDRDQHGTANLSWSTTKGPYRMSINVHGLLVFFNTTSHKFDTQVHNSNFIGKLGVDRIVYRLEAGAHRRSNSL